MTYATQAGIGDKPGFIGGEKQQSGCKLINGGLFLQGKEEQLAVLKRLLTILVRKRRN